GSDMRHLESHVDPDRAQYSLRLFHRVLENLFRPLAPLADRPIKIEKLHLQGPADPRGLRRHRGSATVAVSGFTTGHGIGLLSIRMTAIRRKGRRDSRGYRQEQESQARRGV